LHRPPVTRLNRYCVHPKTFPTVRCHDALRSASSRRGSRATVLGVKSGQIRHQILDYGHLGQGTSSIPFVQASVFAPPMFIEHDPQIPSRHERRKVSVGPNVFLIQMSPSSTMGPQRSRSTR